MIRPDHSNKICGVRSDRISYRVNVDPKLPFFIEYNLGAYILYVLNKREIRPLKNLEQLVSSSETEIKIPKNVLEYYVKKAFGFPIKGESYEYLGSMNLVEINSLLKKIGISLPKNNIIGASELSEILNATIMPGVVCFGKILLDPLLKEKIIKTLLREIPRDSPIFNDGSIIEIDPQVGVDGGVLIRYSVAGGSVVSPYIYYFDKDSLLPKEKDKNIINIGNVENDGFRIVRFVASQKRKLFNSEVGMTENSYTNLSFSNNIGCRTGERDDLFCVLKNGAEVLSLSKESIHKCYGGYFIIVGGNYILGPDLEDKIYLPNNDKVADVCSLPYNIWSVCDNNHITGTIIETTTGSKYILTDRGIFLDQNTVRQGDKFITRRGEIVDCLD